MASRLKSTASRMIGAAMLVAALAIVSLLLLPGRAPAETSPTPNDKATLHIGWAEEPDNLNPFVGYFLESYQVFWLNYDRLVRYDPRTLEPVPGIAESWETSPDGKTWTFHIRKGVRWQDGEPLTAHDVAFTFNYVIKNKLGAFTVYTNHIAKVTATDDFTVRFDCTEPRGTLLQMWVPILPEHIWGKISPEDAENKFANKPPIIGSGPFQVVEWKKNGFVRLVANKDYWGGAPKIDEIVFDVYTNPQTLAADLKLGVLDASSALDPALYLQFKGEQGFAAHPTVRDRFDCLSINCYDSSESLGNPVLRDPRFREALAWATDTEKIVKVAYMGFAAEGNSLLPSNYWKPPMDYHWSPPEGVLRHYDPERAKQVLDAAGYTDTDGDGIREYKGKPIKLRLWADPTTISVGKFMTAWFKDIGIDIALSNEEGANVLDHMYNFVNGKFRPDYDLDLTYWGGDYDPGFLLSLYTTDQIQSWSDTNWSNAEYDRLYQDQDATLDPAKRLDMINRMQEILYKENPALIYAYPQNLEVYNTNRWEGWIEMPTGTGSVANAWSLSSVHPNVGGTASDSGASTGLIVGIVVVVLVVAGIAALVISRQRKAAHREEV